MIKYVKSKLNYPLEYIVVGLKILQDMMTPPLRWFHTHSHLNSCD